MKNHYIKIFAGALWFMLVFTITQMTVWSFQEKSSIEHANQFNQQIQRELQYKINAN